MERIVLAYNVFLFNDIKFNIKLMKSKDYKKNINENLYIYYKHR